MLLVLLPVVTCTARGSGHVHTKTKTHSKVKCDNANPTWQQVPDSLLSIAPAAAIAVAIDHHGQLAVRGARIQWHVVADRHPQPRTVALRSVHTAAAANMGLQGPRGRHVAAAAAAMCQQRAYAPCYHLCAAVCTSAVHVCVCMCACVCSSCRRASAVQLSHQLIVDTRNFHGANHKWSLAGATEQIIGCVHVTWRPAAVQRRTHRHHARGGGRLERFMQTAAGTEAARCTIWPQCCTPADAVDELVPDVHREEHESGQTIVCACAHSCCCACAHSLSPRLQRSSTTLHCTA